MRALRRRALLTGLSLAALAAPGAAAFEAPPMSVVHVTANTGYAAGGHVALRVADYAYHWEVRDDGWLRLGREDWELFQLRYGTLENREMHAVPVALPDAEGERLHRSLVALWSEQGRDLERLDALELARRFVEHRAGAEPPTVAGAGFVSAARPEAPEATPLRDAIEANVGRPFLAAELARVERELGAASAEDVGDLLRLRAALLALRDARGLAPGALVDPEAGAPAPLTPGERSSLEVFARSLEQTVARLLHSTRPDRGRPLLLALARAQALRQSLADGRLLLLDAVDEGEVAFASDESPRHRALARRLAARAAEGWRRERAFAFGAPLDEAAYNELEEAATGAYEMDAALREGRPIRARALGRLVPARRGPVDALAAASPPSEAELAAARAREQAFRALLAERYHYDLLQANCATELAALLREAAPGAAPGRLAFVPRFLARSVAASDVGGESERLPSYRRETVEELARREGRWRTALRESNVLSASAYEGSLEDDAFLFFSDGSPWLRPALGTANLLYGLGHATAGLAAAPLDHGRRLRAGLAGAFYSLPELVGVSIRKGRYDLAPEAGL